MCGRRCQFESFLSCNRWAVRYRLCTLHQVGEIHFHFRRHTFDVPRRAEKLTCHPSSCCTTHERTRTTNCIAACARLCRLTYKPAPRFLQLTVVCAARHLACPRIDRLVT